MTAMDYLTRHQLRNLRAAERRADAVEYMDEVTAVWPDRKTRPPGAAAAYDHAADMLGGRREESR